MIRKPALLFAAICLSGSVSVALASTAETTPEVFAPGTVSGSLGEACPAFTPDGNTVYFDIGSMILVSHRGHQGAQDAWSKPEIAPFSGQWLDHDPTMAPDGSYLVYVSNRSVAGDGKPLDATIQGKVRPGRGGNLWRVDRKGDGWGEPVHLPDAVNASDRTYAPSIAADGSLYFIRPGQDSKFHIFRSAYRNGAYQPAEQVAVGDPKAQTHDPAIAPDQSFMVFNSNDADKPDMGDFYIAFRDGDHWGKPIDLGETINGKPGQWSQWGAHLSPDHRTLYYTSDRTEPTSYPRTLAQAQQQLARMQSWDNGNDNVWSVSLAPWLDAHRATHG